MPTPPRLPRLARRFAALPLLVLVAAAGLAVSAAAAPTLEGISLGEYASGPKVKASDLKGRVVVFEYWGHRCPPCLASIPHLAGIQAKYPYQALIVIANHCQDGDAKNAAKVWAGRKGGDKVAVINQGDLKGTNVSSIPRVFVFDALGKCVFDGNPHDGKFDGAIEKAVKASPGAAAVKKYEETIAGAKALFGDDIPDPLMQVAVHAANTARSSAQPMQLLGRAAKAKDPKIADAAKSMVASFNKAVAKKYDDALAKADSEPAAAWRALEELTTWAPQSPENTKAREQMAKWRRDIPFLKELAADKLWLDLQAQAAKINFEAHPKAKPTSRLESDLKKLLTDKTYTGTKAIDKAKAVAAGWKLDPETGRADKFKAQPKKAPAEVGVEADTQ